jgi:selenide,water dikinase
VVRLTPEVALVQTVDFFPPMVDDPRWFGRVAAANSLSDVWAMGGVPHSCTDVLALPADVPTDVPGEILNGAIEKVEEAGAVLVGGHTVVDPQLKFGLAVTGTIHPEKVVTNAAAKEGDAIVLTKPLGSGFLCTAIKKGTLPDDVALRVMEIMATLNRAASEAMQEVGVHAATDVTGFGLLGHAASMADASATTIRIRARDLPLIEGVEAHATAANTCGGLTKNAAWGRSDGRVRFASGVSDLERAIVADPQTSGGLLICVAKDRLDALLAALTSREVATRAVIGEVVARADASLEVV